MEISQTLHGRPGPLLITKCRSRWQGGENKFSCRRMGNIDLQPDGQSLDVCSWAGMCLTANPTVCTTRPSTVRERLILLGAQCAPHPQGLLKVKWWRYHRVWFQRSLQDMQPGSQEAPGKWGRGVFGRNKTGTKVVSEKSRREWAALESHDEKR